MQNNHIVFVRNIRYNTPNQKANRGFSKFPNFGKKADENIGSQTICLLDKLKEFDIFQRIPKLFTIKTNNGSCNFNLDMILNTSSVISDFFRDNPQNFQYHIDVDDKGNVLSKIQRMYEGETVVFEEDELLVSQKIAKILNFVCFPNFLKPETLKRTENIKYSRGSKLPLAAELNISDFSQYLRNIVTRTFTIITNKHVYNCNPFGVLSSNIISDIIKKNPLTDHYVYDYSNEFDEFQNICDLFNFEKVTLTMDNINSIKEIAEDLQISCLLKDVEKYINNKENVSKTIDEQQTIVDTIDDLFDMLYNIKEITVQTVAKNIINSKWSKTNDDVRELAAFIIQVIKTDFLLHPYMIDLLRQIDENSNESNKLKKLLPFIISFLTYTAFNQYKKTINNYPTINSFKSGNQNNMAIYGFIYSLLKNGMITNEELKENLINYNFVSHHLNLWFLPELIEIYTFEVIQKQVINGLRSNCKTFILSYFPDKIDKYKEIRDKGEPDDELTKALRNDDVDTLQSIISKSNIDFNNAVVPINIFENFIDNGNTRYINYAAAYGSLKCFKFLFLNHAIIDMNTFPCAVFGGNSEIIKIVHQQKNEDLSSYVNILKHTNPIFSYNEFISAIIKHRNDLFDWIFTQDAPNNDKNILDLFQCSAENGNAHSLIEIIEKNINCEYDQKIFNYCLCAAENGFYMITQLLFKFISGNLHIKNANFSSVVNFGNLSIFKLFIEKMNKNRNQLENALTCAAKRGYMNIIKFYFDTIINENNDFALTESLLFNLLSESASNKTNKMFKFLFDKIKIIYPSLLNNFDWINQLLDQVCKTKNVEAAKILTELIIEKNNYQYFTSFFITAALNGSIDICKYFIDKKVYVEYEILSSFIDKINASNEDIFLLIIQNLSPETQELFFECIDQTIQNKNKKLVDYLLNKGAFSENALKLAVETNDLELVNIILKYNAEPSFINKPFKNGTALTIAATNNNLLIFKRLLSLPGIDPSLFGYQNINPLFEAIEKQNLNIFDPLLDFCGENIGKHKWMIIEAIQKIVDPQQKSSSDQFDINLNPTNLNSTKSIDHILNRFLDLKCIDINYHFNRNTLLTFACSINSFTLVANILEHDNINVNLPESINGDTPLIIAVKEGNYEIAKLLVDHSQIDVNIQNFDQQTALSIASQNELMKFIDLIISNDKFDPKLSRLNYTFFLSKGEISKQLSAMKELDVNYVNSHKSSLIDAVLSGDLAKVKLIIRHPSFDMIKSQFKTALKENISKDQKEIFVELIKILSTDLNTYKIDNRNILDYAAINASQDIIDEILNNPNFDSNKSDILKAFVDSYSIVPNTLNQNNFGNNRNNFMNNQFNFGNNRNNFMNNQNNVMNNQNKSPIDVMNQLYNYDKEHDHLIDFNNLLSNGKSFFTTLTNNKYEDEIVRFFLEHGVDPNKPDSKGIFPLEYAIIHYLSGCALELIKSDKIDFTQKIQVKCYNEIDESTPKYTTYLHLAASSQLPEILEELLNRNVIDINAKNDFGDTPLIEACKVKNKRNIMALFESDFCNNCELDFRHKNNNGDDAIKFVNPSSNSENINDKDIYLNKLLSFLGKSDDFDYSD